MTTVSLSAQQSHQSNLFLDINTYLPTYSTLAIQKDAAKLETFFKISVFWDVMLCSASNPWCFKGPQSLQFQGWGLILLGPWRRRHYWSLPMSQTAHPHIPQDWNLQQHRRENIKSCGQNSPFSTSRLALASHQPRSLSQEVTSLGCGADRSCPCGAPCIFLSCHSLNIGTLYLH
jgi:hypothetical protein